MHNIRFYNIDIAFTVDSKDASYYHGPIHVLNTSMGPIWNAENVSTALFDSPMFISCGILNNHAKRFYYAKTSLNGFYWMNWDQLKKWLEKEFPEIEHRFSWWTGGEKQLK